MLKRKSGDQIERDKRLKVTPSEHVEQIQVTPPEIVRSAELQIAKPIIRKREDGENDAARKLENMDAHFERLRVTHESLPPASKRKYEDSEVEPSRKHRRQDPSPSDITPAEELPSPSHDTHWTEQRAHTSIDKRKYEDVEIDLSRKHRRQGPSPLDMVPAERQPTLNDLNWIEQRVRALPNKRKYEDVEVNSARKHGRQGPSPLDKTYAEIPAPTVRGLGWIKHESSTLHLIEIAYEGLVSYALGTSDQLHAYGPRAPCRDNALAKVNRRGWPSLLGRSPFKMLAVATNSVSGVPPHWDLLDSHLKSLSYEMLMVDFMFSAVILVECRGQITWELTFEIPNTVEYRSIFAYLSPLARKNEQNFRNLTCNHYTDVAGLGR
jgi:hypothetical protein